MGRSALIFVFVIMILIGTIMIVLHEKQVHAVDKLVETTQFKQARHLANSYVKTAIPELKEMVVVNNGIEGIDQILNTYNNKPAISIDSNLPNATSKTIINRNEFQGQPLEDDQFAISNIITFTGEDGETYEVESHILFAYGMPYSPPPDPYSPPDPASVGVASGSIRPRLNFILRTDVLRLGYPQANNDNNDLFQHYPNQHTVWDDVTMARLEQSGFSYVVPANHPPTGGVDVRAANHHSSGTTPENPNYPLKFYLPRRNDNNNPVRQFRIDGHFFAKEKKRENLELYIDGNVLSFYSAVNANIRQIYANIYYTGTINLNLGSSATSVSYQGGTLWTGTNKEIYTRQVTRKELEDLWDQRHEDILPEDVCPICLHYNCNCVGCIAGACTSCGGSSTPPSEWVPIIKTLIEDPVRKVPK